MRSLEPDRIEVSLAEAVTGLAWGRVFTKDVLLRWRRIADRAATGETRLELEAVGSMLLTCVADGKLRALGRPFPDGGEPEPISKGLLLQGCFVDVFSAEEICRDWMIDRNFGLEDRGYTGVVLDLQDLDREFQFRARVRNGQPGLTATPGDVADRTGQHGARFSLAEIRDWYRHEWIIGHEAAGSIPTRDQEVEAARLKFGPRIPIRTMRQLRKEFAPERWKRRGRRRSKN